MNRNKVKELLDALACGNLEPDEVYEQLKHLPYRDIGFAKIDSHRCLRQGMPEVIFCPGKTPEQVVKIAQDLKANHDLVLATRLDPEPAAAVLSVLTQAHYDPCSRVLVWGAVPQPEPGSPRVAAVAAGTADLPVAEEAAVVLASAGVSVQRLYDVGVAGIHRLFDNLETLKQASVIIVVAGMDGALPSVVGGLVEQPVIAVPTSVGYGASFQGLAALLTMLNSCAAGLCVVNIDNGFGAAAAALRILSQTDKPGTADGARLDRRARGQSGVRPDL